MRAVLGWLRGEPKHCSMVPIPTPTEEYARRPSRERETLVREQTRVVNRMKAMLIRFGIRDFNVKLRKAMSGLDKLRADRKASRYRRMRWPNCGTTWRGCR